LGSAQLCWSVLRNDIISPRDIYATTGGAYSFHETRRDREGKTRRGGKKFCSCDGGHTAYNWLGKNRPAALVLVEDIEGIDGAQSGGPDVETIENALLS
jgi:hypothetical protein